MRPSIDRDAGLAPAVSHPTIDARRRRQRIVVWPRLALHTHFERDRLGEALRADQLQVARQVKRAFASQQELVFDRPPVRRSGASDAVALDQPAVGRRTVIYEAKVLVLDLDGI